MNPLTRYEPFRTLRRELDRLFEDLPMLRDGEAEAAWMPRLDLAETDAAFVARMDLPGLTPEDIEVDVHVNRLTIRGERKADTREEKENVVRTERSFGSFYRALTLPRNVLADGVEATFANGVLTVQIPKAEESKPHRIEVRPVKELEPA